MSIRLSREVGEIVIESFEDQLSGVNTEVQIKV
jgi:hypothetical protein